MSNGRLIQTEDDRDSLARSPVTVRYPAATRLPKEHLIIFRLQEVVA